MTIGFVLLVAVLALRLAIKNRHVRGRLAFSAVMLAIQIVITGATSVGTVSPELQEAISPFLPLLIALAVINGVVALTLNPWNTDGLPDRFPTIVQDTVVIVLFAMATTIVLQERVFATTAVGAVVIGFALQDTLGNLFAGLAIQIEKPFRVGHWVRIADVDGQVSEITWRATRIRTKAGNFVIVPNSTLSKDTITNYSEPTLDCRVEVEVGATYDAAPNVVKAVILEAVRDEPLVAPSRPPEVHLADFGASAITYRVRVWTTDFAADERLQDRLRSAIYYAFKRAGVVIPYPIQVEIPGESTESSGDPALVQAALKRVVIFSALDDETIGRLAATARAVTFAAGETIVRQGDVGTSMFVIVTGEAVVLLSPGGQEVARLGEGAFFGEMSLLTGAVRNATVKSVTDVEALQLTGDAFRTFVLGNPVAVELIGAALAQRAAELEQARQSVPGAPVESAASLVERVRRFLRL